MTINSLFFRDFWQDLKRYKYFILVAFILGFILSSITVYGFVYNGVAGWLSIGTTTPQGSFYIDDGGTMSQYIVGMFSSLPPNAQSAYPLFVLLPIEVVALIFLVVIIRIPASTTVKALGITLAMAVIGVMTFLIVQGMMNTLGL